MMRGGRSLSIETEEEERKGGGVKASRRWGRTPFILPTLAWGDEKRTWGEVKNIKNPIESRSTGA